MFIANMLHAQQKPQVSHNLFNHIAINPGFAGMQGEVEITGIARQQWHGLQDGENNRINPESYFLTAHAPVPFLAGGLSMGVMQDNLGYETTTGLQLGYSYHLKAFGGRVGIGLTVGFLDKVLDIARLRPINPNDPLLIGALGESQIFADIGLGAFYIGQNNHWVGLSISQILQARGPNDVGQLRRHAHFSAGHPFTMAALPAIKFTPSFLIKSDFHSIQFDINAIAEYNNRLWGGVSYRLQDAIVVLLGVNIGQFRVGYSYDITTSALGRAGKSHGSHEVMIRYSFELLLERAKEVQRNIRFL